MISNHTVDFGNTGAQAVMKFLFLLCKVAVKTHGKAEEAFKDDCPSHTTVNVWVSRLEIGHIQVTGHPTSATATEDKPDAVHVKTFKD